MCEEPGRELPIRVHGRGFYQQSRGADRALGRRFGSTRAWGAPIHGGMMQRSLPARRLVTYARADSFAGNTRAILARLGCCILSPEEFAAQNGAQPGLPSAPDLYLVDERRIRDLPATVAASVPVVLMAVGHQRARDDARFVAAVRCPVGMHDLYRVVQEVLEDVPRSTPRVDTELAAQCRYAGQDWTGSVLSLSENGCLLKIDEELPLGADLRVAFTLPDIGKLHVRAESAYEIKSCHGLVFSSTSPQIREAISGFVIRRLLEMDPATPFATG